ncbi:MAG: hypothetical protein WBA92_14790, partial [Pseudorhodobacter sp.]
MRAPWVFAACGRDVGHSWGDRREAEITDKVIGDKGAEAQARHDHPKRGGDGRRAGIEGFGGKKRPRHFCAGPL